MKSIFIVYPLILSYLIRVGASRKVSPAKCIIWGPGLEVKVTTPARYFFIQAIDTNSERYTESAGTFSVSFTREDRSSVRLNSGILDRQDGSYIVRYRLHESLENLLISIYFRDEQVADSPYLLKGMAYHEFCRCPELDREKWHEDFKCPLAYHQIRSDLYPFSSINMTDLLPKMIEKYSMRQLHSLCHYKIIDNKIYMKCHGEIIDFRVFSNELLVSLSRKVRLPDMEFLVNLGDWPIVKDDVADPVMSWCGSVDTQDIVMPTYNLMDATFNMMSRVSLDILSTQKSTYIWEDKLEKGFFRGRDSRQERLDLMEISQKHPEIIDAALTNMFFFEKNEEKYGKIVKSISFFEFFKYKYQINIDGTVAAYRLPYLMGGNSVILKQDSPFYEHFYSELTPWVHYIPFKRDLSDLMEQIQWARENDAKAKQIARNALDFVNANLLPQHVFCYYVRLFEEYSKLLVSKPTVDESFELIGDDKSDTYNNYRCDCKHTGPGHDEL